MFHLATSELMHLLTTYGYWAVLVFVAIESTGIPFPGETMLLVAAIYAGTAHQLSLALVIAAAAGGLLRTLCGGAARPGMVGSALSMTAVTKTSRSLVC